MNTIYIITMITTRASTTTSSMIANIKFFLSVMIATNQESICIIMSLMVVEVDKTAKGS